MALQSKVMACIYGLICLSIAFIAQYLGGVLQSALTIFGVVGGPLFGIFTLGMFTMRANEIVCIIFLPNLIIPYLSPNLDFSKTPM